MASAAAVETHSGEAELEEEEDEEYEYEEIEVEEEVIEEIEVEVDEDEEADDDFGEPVTSIDEENHRNDNCPSKEPERDEETMKEGSERNEEVLKSGVTVPRELIGNAPDDSGLEGCKGNQKRSASSETSRQGILSDDTLSPKRDEDPMKSGFTVPKEFIMPDDSVLEGCKTSKQDLPSGNRTPEDHCGTSSVDDRWVKNAERVKLLCREAVNAENTKLSSGERVYAGGAENSNSVQHLEEERDRIVPENAVGTRKRSDPRHICQIPDLIDGNKRAAIICDFFAKGWCIKGKSCRFLHISDKVADASQLKVFTPDAVKQKSEPPKDDASSVAQNSVRDDGGRENGMCEAGGSSSPKDASGSSMPNHFERDHLRTRSYLEYAGHYASKLVKDKSPAYGNGSYHQPFSNSPLMSSDNRKTLGISSASRNAESIHTQDRLVSDLEFQVSLSSSSQSLFSAFPGSQSGYHPRTNFSGDALRPAEYKTTNKSYGDWEPSVPFRPSYLITQRLLAKANLYDPILDNVERPNSGDGCAQVPLCGQSASKDETKSEKANEELVGALNSEDCSSRNFASSRNFHNGEVGKSVFQKDPSTAHSGIADTAAAEKQGKTSLPLEERSSNSSHVQNMGEADKIDVDSESALQIEKHKHKLEPKMDRSRQRNDTDANLKINGYVQDSKASKHFHAALVEHLKELLRPKWEKGLLGRDAHKMIIKKAVDKVFNTLQPLQIPNTPETVEQYLVVSQSKLAKLVEAYVCKYGKL